MHSCKLLLLSLLFASSIADIASFTLPLRGISGPAFRLSLAASSTDDLLTQIRSMRVKEIKEELQSLQKPTNDVFEKEELVQRLLQARQEGKDSQSHDASSVRPVTPLDGVVTAPLYFTSMDKDLRVAAVNMDGGITVEPSEQPYATIQIEVVQDNGKKRYTLSLLLDTACSGFVLRPEIQEKYNMPKFQTPVTMTGAAGTSAATGLTQIQKFTIGGQSFGPLPAAVQDIGALPSSLDGIIGLSFLNQFAAVELDFKSGVVSFYKDVRALPKRTNVVAESDMRMLGSLGIFTTDVYFGGRGPVSMLVDTGAACTLLNWKGVNDLGLSKNAKQLLPLRTPFGAIGSDNIALELSHRLNVSSKLQLGNNKDRFPGIVIGKTGRLSVDIGQIPVIDNLQTEGVGGILGVDALMRCGVVRVSCREPAKITLYS